MSTFGPLLVTIGFTAGSALIVWLVARAVLADRRERRVVSRER